MLTFGWKDAIDIFVVACILFYFYRTTKQTRASAIFSGIIVFLIIWIFVSEIFHMRLLGTMFDKLVNIGLLALIVLFQEEIRRFFSMLGTQHKANHLLQSLFVGKKREGLREDVMPLVLACMNMGRQRIGALVVLERASRLNDIVDSGELIDACISQRLIENIFFKGSPLHDGALIISQGKIKAAGCILPVAHDSDIPKSLGLRHRAGLGISQKTDAIAVMVSEETGNIATAINGKLHLKLTPEELEQELTENRI